MFINTNYMQDYCDMLGISCKYNEDPIVVMSCNEDMVNELFERNFNTKLPDNMEKKSDKF